jgi:hypothetical protein
MVVVCDMVNCGFYDNGFCSQKVIKIEGGACGHVYRKGVMRGDWQEKVDDKFKDKAVVIDANVRDAAVADNGGK